MDARYICSIYTYTYISSDYIIIREWKICIMYYADNYIIADGKSR